MKNTIQSNARTTSANVRGRRLRQTMGSLGVLLLLGTSATAQNPTGPFSGQYQEGFEVNTSFALGYAPNPVLQGNASYHTSSAYQAISWSFSCTMQSNGGNRFVGDIGGLMWLDFSAGASKFGGYFGSNQPGAPITVDVRFFDSGNSLFATDVVTLQNNCSWQWMGWDFPLSNIYRIEFETAPYPGFLMMDDLELDLPVVNNCYETFCFGDDPTTPCPCGNSLPNNTTSGCGNTTGAGASLSMSGSCSSSAADAGLLAENLIPYQWGLFFEGGSMLPSFGVPFFDGMLCVGGPYAGLQFVVADSTGVAGPITDIFYKGLPYMPYHLPGYTSYYQCFYRDNNVGVCGTKWNLTNGVKLMWTP